MVARAPNARVVKPSRGPEKSLSRVARGGNRDASNRNGLQKKRNRRLGREKKKLDRNGGGIREYLSLLFEVLCALGYRARKSEKAEFVQREWLRMSGGKNPRLQPGYVWFKIVKYKLDAFVAIFTTDEGSIPTLPKAPQNFITESIDPNFGDNPKFLCGGRPGRFITKLIKNEKSKMSLLQSFKSLKQACPSVPAKFIKESVEEEFNTLTREPYGLPETVNPKDYEDLLETFQGQVADMEDWVDPTDWTKEHPGLAQARGSIKQLENLLLIREGLRRTVDELYRTAGPVQFKAIMPSTSANYIDNNEAGGSVATLLSEPEFELLRRPGGYVVTGNERMERTLMEEAEDFDRTYKEIDETESQWLKRELKKLSWRGTTHDGTR